jgi:tetratricopeptide (TPR) repeat protein
VALLRAALAATPNAREVHEKLCDTLIEAGDQDGAVRQMLAFATALADQRDVEAAARVLDEVLLLEPDRADALQMLQSLGYAVPAAYAPAPEYVPAEVAPPEIVAVAPASGYHDAPLPSYDLEEVSADQAMLPAPEPARPLATSQLDDPFVDAPLPSFPIEEDATQFMEAPPPFSARPELSADAPPVSPLDEDALEEAEFFLTHGMFDEARAILDEQLSRLPSHPLLLERKRELEAAAASASAPVATESGTREAPVGPPDVDRSFDIAASLEALDALDVSAAPEPSAEEDPRQVSVESVFEQFKAGVAAQISESDAATHYDLGVAYKEMGLVEDAIHEFSLAARDPGRECVCWSMIGMLRLSLGQVETAIDAFILGLHASQRTTEQELALNYEIGNAYEMHAPDNALYYFQLVARIDPNYRDGRGTVRERIARLAPVAKPAPARAAGDPFADDFDAAFDELLGSGKLP